MVAYQSPPDWPWETKGAVLPQVLPWFGAEWEANLWKRWWSPRRTRHCVIFIHAFDYDLHTLSALWKPISVRHIVAADFGGAHVSESPFPSGQFTEEEYIFISTIFFAALRLRTVEIFVFNSCLIRVYVEWVLISDSLWLIRASTILWGQGHANGFHNKCWARNLTTTPKPVVGIYLCPDQLPDVVLPPFFVILWYSLDLDSVALPRPQWVATWTPSIVHLDQYAILAQVSSTASYVH